MRAITAHERWLAEHHLDAGPGQAPLLTIAGLHRLVQACPDTRAGFRDRALVLIGFGIAARRSELAGLAADDITADYHGGTLRGVVVRVRSSKTGQGPNRADRTRSGSGHLPGHRVAALDPDQRDLLRAGVTAGGSP